MTQTLNEQTSATAQGGSKHTARPAFRASQKLGDNMQQVLVDLTDLHLQGKQLHWNLVGKNFRDTRLALDEVVDAAREFTDTVAERMRAVYVTPDARVKTVAANSTLPELPTDEIDTADAVDAVVASLYAVVGTVRKVHDEVDEEDPTSADVLHGVLERLEQLAWMLDAENRVANESAPPSKSE